jgi:hypothetical protein
VAELLERLVRADPWVGASTPLACSIQTRLVSACRSWATSTSRLASSTPVLTSSAVTTASAPSASTSPGDQARGWLAYTSRVPTGRSASRTGTLSTPRTCNWPTTAAIRSQTSSRPKSWTAHHPVLGEGGQARPLSDGILRTPMAVGDGEEHGGVLQGVQGVPRLGNDQQVAVAPFPPDGVSNKAYLTIQHLHGGLAGVLVF